MGLIKQVMLTLGVAIAAFYGWAWYYPSAPTLLHDYGLDRLPGLPAPMETAAISGRGGQNRQGGFSNQALVTVAPVSKGVVNDRLTAIGNGQAIRSVTVTPLVSGQIANVLVVSGARVNAGDVIVRLDSQSEEIARDRANIAVTNAANKLKRYEELFARRATTSVEVDNVRTELDNARLQLREAELALDRRTVTAPIAGVIGILSLSEGDFVTNQTTITTIDDRSEIIVEFWVPERFIGKVSLGAPVAASAIAMPGVMFDGAIVAVDNRIEQDSRTLRVQAEIPNANDRLRAGMAFQVSMRFAGDPYPSVDPLAIQWDSAGSYVWLLADGKAERRDATIVQRNSDSVLVKADISSGDQVIVEGVQNLRDGAVVKVIGDASPSGSEDGARNGKAGS